MVKMVYGPERFLVKREVTRFEKQAAETGAMLIRSEECTENVLSFAKAGFIDYAVCISLNDISEIKGDFENLDNPVLIVLQKTPTDAQLKKLPAGIEPLRFDRPSVENAKAYVAAYVGKIGKQITYEACDALLDRMGYGEDDNIGLTDVFHELDKLGCLEGEIEEQTVQAYVTESIVYDTFKLSDCIKAGDRNGAYDILEKFFKKKNNPSAFQSECLGLVALLGQNFRVAYKANYANNPKAEIGVYRIPEKMSKEKAFAGMKICADADSKMKSGAKPDKVIMILVEELMRL